MYSIETICSIVQGRFLQKGSNDAIEHLSCDSRNIQFASQTLFFAISTPQGDGHIYVADAFKKGVRNFIVSKEIVIADFEQNNIILVDHTVMALQSLAAYHRGTFTIPVIGITGSNGKTVVKEWLYQLLQDDYNIIRSPKSYNSQIGVPLSVWQMNSRHTLALFEAGISQKGEMENLASIIQPTISIITTIGEAHSSGFASVVEKTEEKLKLVKGAEVIVYCREALPAQYGMNNDAIQRTAPDAQLLNWSFTVPAVCNVKDIKRDKSKTGVTFIYDQKEYSVNIPFTDEASVQNSMNCVCTMLYLKYEERIINERLQRLHAIDMRLQLKHGSNHCLLINDSYSADLTSLRIALQFLKQQSSGLKRTVILSDFYESGLVEEELYSAIKSLLHLYKVEKLIGIGEQITKNLKIINDKWSPLYKIECSFYPDTNAFIHDFKSSHFSKECILIKGARKFEFERIVSLFDAKVHQTLLEINLAAIAHNLKQYQQIIKKGTKVMAMVKAFAYGSGGAEIAGVLQYNNIDYLGVAYTDEGIELRKAGISVPIMVMNADKDSFAALIEYQLQPVVYSMPFLQSFEDYLCSIAILHYPVHIEVETGMNRLGFALSEIGLLARHLSQSEHIKIESVFSHLAASDNAAQNEFTFHQATLFQQAITEMERHINYPFIKHIANSAAIIRHPELQLDMVRLGIGLYGIEIATQALALQQAATLRTTIAQIKKVKKGETVSYNRLGVLNDDATIATTRIGYADGYSRRLGNGVGKMLVNNNWAPVVGSVCMDMTMIDITGISDVQEGDEVLVFGEALPVEQLAAWMGTIPYEVMTSVSQRVKRIYFQE